MVQGTHFMMINQIDHQVDPTDSLKKDELVRIRLIGV